MKKSKETLWQVDIRYACFGIVSEDGVVIEAAPIGRWMIGKDIAFVRRWVNGKRGTMIEVKSGKH